MSCCSHCALFTVLTFTSEEVLVGRTDTVGSKHARSLIPVLPRLDEAWPMSVVTCETPVCRT